MVKYAIVSLKDVVREGRWDAGFHIALSELKDDIEDLRTRYSDEEATRMVDRIPLSDKAAIEVLRIGSRRWSMNAQEAREVARKYPHLALAMVAQNAEAAVKRIRAEVERSQDALARLIELSERRAARLGDIRTEIAGQ